MPELTLMRAEAGRYTLGDLGTLRSGRRFAAALEALHHLDALPLLFCCHIVKRVVDTTMEAGSVGPPVAGLGG